jgi:hypothetical protein
MARGRNAEIGDKSTAANGYHYVRCASGWRLEHHVIAEETLGRAIDTGTDRVIFKDGDRDNLNPTNIIVKDKGVTSNKTRKARLKARIAELQAEYDAMED